MNHILSVCTAAFRSILAWCSRPQGTDPFTTCNTDVLCMIFALCDIPTLAHLAQVCRLLRDTIALDGRLKTWRTIFNHNEISRSMVIAIDANEVALVYYCAKRGAVMDVGFLYYLERRCPFYRSVKANNKELIQFFMDKVPPFQGLCGACVSGNISYVKHFLSEVDAGRAEVMVHKKRAVLMEYAGQSGHLEMVKYLLNRMDNVPIGPRLRRHAIERGLYGACSMGHQCLAEAFIGLGALNVSRALSGAIRNRRFNMARWIVAEKSHLVRNWNYALAAAEEMVEAAEEMVEADEMEYQEYQEWSEYLFARIKGREADMPRTHD